MGDIRAEVIEMGSNVFNNQQYELGDSLLNFIIIQIFPRGGSAPFSKTSYYLKTRNTTGGGLALISSV